MHTNHAWQRAGAVCHGRPTEVAGRTSAMSSRACEAASMRLTRPDVQPSRAPIRSKLTSSLAKEARQP
eukprot:scaffold201756_cov23-Prasinocladus_malaysianus.AAC.1